MKIPDPNQFLNPFPVEGEYDANKHARVMFDMPKPIKEAVTDCHRKYGSIQTVGNILWLKLINYLDQHGITDFTNQLEFEQHIANLRFVDGRPNAAGGTVTGPLSEAASPNVNGRETGLAATHQNPPSEPVNPPRPTRSGSGKRTAGDTKAKKVTKSKPADGSQNNRA